MDLQTLLYPLGFLSTLPFTARFLIQWIASEKAQKSVVTRSFWYLSLIGNGALCLHSFIQQQITVALVQVLNGIISWRNLNLMNTPEKQVSRNTVILMMIVGSFLSFVPFLLEGLLTGTITWMRSPSFFWSSDNLSPSWHLVGALGILLFTSRFGVQWWYAEQQKESHFTASFWWLSLSGAILSVLYFFKMGDIVNLVGPAVGILNYSRNLIIMRNATILVKEESHG